MTCVAGLVHEGKVYMGADSAGITGDRLTLRRDPKVFSVGEIVVGFTSSFRMGQVLRYGFTLPQRAEGVDAYQYLCTDVVDALRNAFCRHGVMTMTNGVESCGTFLLGYRGALYTIWSDFQVASSLAFYDACGSGAEYAVGSLFSTEGLNMTPRQRLTLALSAAEHHCPSVRGPFVILPPDPIVEQG